MHYQNDTPFEEVGQIPLNVFQSSSNDETFPKTFNQSLPLQDETSETVANSLIVVPPEYASDSIEQQVAWEELVRHLHRGGGWAYYWTASLKRYADDHPNPRLRRQSVERLTFWFPAGECPPPPPEDGPYGKRQIYFGVNPTIMRRGNPQKGQRATLASISVVNALIGEIDLKNHDGDWAKLFAAINNLLLPPSVIIISGGGTHLYWLFATSFMLDDGTRKQKPERLAYIRSIQHRWVEEQPALDQGAKDLTRLLRPVGTTNNKAKYAPNYPQVRIIKADFSLLYELSQIEKVLPIRPLLRNSKAKKRSPPKLPAHFPKSNWHPPENELRPRPLNDLQKAQFYIRYFDPSCGRREWFEIGCMLTALGEAGLAIWDQWSSQSYKYLPGEPHDLWPNMSVGGGLGLGTLIFRAINEHGAPKFLRRNEPSDEALNSDWSRDTERSYRPKQSSEVVDVGEVDAHLTEIFCPQRISYFWLNVPEADTVIQSATKHDGPLLGVLRKALNRNKRQIRIKGKRKRTVMSILSNPVDQNGMTSVWPLVCHSDDVSGLMGILAELGLDSFAYQIPLYLPSSMALPKVCQSAQFAIPYIYRADAQSTKIYLEKMAKIPNWHTFGSLGLERAFMILVMFAQPEPVGLIQAVAARWRVTPPTQHNSELWYPLSVIPGMADPTSPKVYYPIIHDGEEVSMRLVYKGLEKILSDYRFVGHHDLVDAWAQLPAFEVEKLRAKLHEVGEGDKSAIRHFNREYDLSDVLGVDVSQKVVGCPWCGGEMVIWPALGQGHHAAYCECQPYEVLTPFRARMKCDGLSQEQLVHELRSNPQTHYGRAGGFSVEYSSHLLEEEKQTQQGAQLRLEAHLADIEARRKKRREQIKAFKPGVIYIYRDSPGFGKSYVFQVDFVPQWKQMQKKIIVTTETRAQSEDWLRLRSRCNAKVYLPVTDSCHCYPADLLAEAINKSYTIKHKAGCAYLEQRKELKEGRVVFIMRHDHLIANLFAQTDVFVHDESIVNKLLRNYRADLMDDVLRLLNLIQNDKGSSHKDRQNLRLTTALIDALFHLAHKTKLKPYMQLRADKLIERLRNYLKSHEQYSEVTLEDAIQGAKESKYGTRPTLSGDEQKGQLRHSWLPTFIEALEKTLANPVHPTVWLVQESQSLSKPPGGKAVNKLAYHWYIKHQYMSNLKKKSLHFILDASANAEIYQALLPGWQIVICGEQIPLSPMCQVFQIVGINTTKKELRRNLVGIAKKIAHIANEQDLLIDAIGTHKEFKKALAALFDVPEEMTLHYRNQRGSNSYEGANCLLGLGDSNVPASVVERVSHALHSDSHKAFETYNNGQLVTVVRGGRATGKDKRVQAVARMMQEEEAYQFVQRLRGILAEKKKIVLYVGRYDFSQFGIETQVCDASQLKGQSKVVRHALDLYHARKSNQ